MQFKFSKWDIIIPLVALVVAGILFINGRNTDTGTAEITVDGVKVYTADLTQEKDKILEFGEITVEIRDGEIGIVSSPCIGKDCIKTGFISHPGETIVCIPEKTVIKIIGQSKNSPDAISY